MKVTTGTKISNGRSIDVELEGFDGERTFKNWGQLDVMDQFKKLSAFADILILQYLLRDSEITQEHFNERVAVLGKELK